MCVDYGVIKLRAWLTNNLVNRGRGWGNNGASRRWGPHLRVVRAAVLALRVDVPRAFGVAGGRRRRQSRVAPAGVASLVSFADVRDETARAIVSEEAVAAGLETAAPGEEQSRQGRNGDARRGVAGASPAPVG